MFRIALVRGAFCLHFALLLGAVAGSRPVPPDQTETWTEVTTPHFTVMSDDGEKTARHVADQFEQIRQLYSKAFNGRLRVDPGTPILIVAVKNEKLLSEVIPEYWARKGNVHPAGLFVPGPEKSYIAVRTNVSGEVPYLPVYHEYVHLIVNLNYHHFPLWLNEGFADFLGNATLVPSGGAFGQFNSSYLNLLLQTKLLPLETVFRVNPRSPYYNEASKANIFYAESWALVHYMMTDPSKRGAKLLGKYVEVVENGGDPVESARTLFGDLGKLQRELQFYVSRTVYKEYVITFSDPSISTNYKVRTLSTAEVDERLGDFDLYRGQLDSARPKIEEALRLDPMLASPQESMGLLLFRQGKLNEAQTYFSRALALDSTSALVNFFQGMLSLSSEDDDKTDIAAQRLLEKAVALNPLLAPAWDYLGMLYSRDPAAMDKALSAVRNAEKAMPGEHGYQLDEASILMAMNRFNEARTIAAAVKNLADPLVSSRAELLLYQIDQANNVAGLPDPYLGRGVDPFGRSAGFYGADVSDLNSSLPVLKRRRIGTIEAVDCTGDPAITITFREADSVKSLHIASLSLIDIRVGPAKSPTEKLTCDDLKAKKVSSCINQFPTKRGTARSSPLI